MSLVPTEAEVLVLLRKTGALREGFFEYPNGLYSNQHLQMALAFRHYQDQKLLSVALSRRIRENPEIRAVIDDLSIVSPSIGGLPVAYGVCEALRAKQVYWAERENEDEPLRFRQFLEQHSSEKVLIVDDILRSGRRIGELKELVERNGAELMGIAVVVHQPTPQTPDFAPLPLFYLVKLESQYCSDRDSCPIPAPGQQPEKIWI